MPRCKFCEFEETDARVMHWHLRMMHGRNLRSASQFVRWMFPRPKAKAESGKRKAESGKRKAESGKRKAESGKE